MSSALLAAATSPPAGGAPLSQVIGATVAGMLLTAGLLVIGLRYRDGRMPLLDLVARPFVLLLGSRRGPRCRWRSAPGR